MIQEFQVSGRVFVGTSFMATITRCEEIEVWKVARELTKVNYRLTCSAQFAKDYGLKDQIRRASVSVMSNIAEGFERDGTREFLQFLSTAKGSAGEVRSQLYVALDAGHIDNHEFENARRLAEDTVRLIPGLMRSLSQCNIRGDKFRN